MYEIVHERTTSRELATALRRSQAEIDDLLQRVDQRAVTACVTETGISRDDRYRPRRLLALDERSGGGSRLKWVLIAVIVG